MRRLVWAIAMLGVAGVGSQAMAQGLDWTSLRTWAAPQGVDPRLGQVREDGQGTTLLVMSEGQELESRCVVVVAYAEEALSYRYRRAGAPSRCEDAVVLPDEAGFVVRGDRLDLPTGIPTGFLARVDRSGEEVWAVEDRQALDAPAGVGSYVGEWEATVRGMAYDPLSSMVVALSQSLESVGGSLRETVQLHGVDAESGEFLVVGERPDVAQNEVMDDVTADAAGGFWVTLKEVQGPGRRLAHYDGAGGWREFLPEVTGWEAREVVGPVRTMQEGSVVVFWRLRGEAISGVTRVLGDAVIFDQELLFEAELDGRWWPLNDVARGWAGPSYIGALRQTTDGQRVLDLLSPETGERVAAQYWEGLAPGVELGLVSDVQGEPVVLTYFSVDESLREFRLGVVEEDDRTPGTGADGEGSEEGGCAVAGGAGSGGVLGWLLVGMCVWGVGRRGARAPYMCGCQAT